jgi:sirohydrochlorin ferrochelatase
LEGAGDRLGSPLDKKPRGILNKGTMETYDPETAPDAAEWLELEEDERVSRVSAYHRHAKIKLPNLQVHAALHSVVENQIAEELQTVRETVARLQAEGLSRHDAIHAVGSVLVARLQALMREGAQAQFAVETYFQELRSLTAEGWLKS